MQLDEQFAFVWTVRDGKPVRMEQYPSRLEALEAVGLEGQAMSQENLEILKGITDA